MHYYFKPYWLVLATFALVAVAPEQSAGQEPVINPATVQAELIWTDFDGERHLLMHAQLQAAQWSEPQAIYVSNNAITTPTLATLSSESLRADFAMWTEQRKAKTILMQTRRIERAVWQPGLPFYSEGQDNFSPTVITDLGNTSYVFWSSTQANNYSDIVYSAKNDAAANSASEWSVPRRLHASNAVPDLAPSAVLQANGEILVTWQTFDASALQYVPNSAVVSGSTDLQHLADTNPDYVDPVDLRKLALPSFLPRDRSFTLFSALNKLERAIVLP